MKKMVKPLVFMMSVVVLATLLIIPGSVTAKDIEFMPGKLVVINEIPTCFCPAAAGCQCVIILPPKE